MPIEKLEEFARDGQKNTDELILTDGFPRPKFPARQWFNYLFNMLSLKINELIDLDPIARNEIVDNLTTNDATKPLSAKQGKDLQDSKLEKSALNNTLTSTSTTQALTAAQGKMLNDQAFGVGQTWQDVKAIRVSGTAYTNTTGKTITVYVEISSADVETITIEAGGITLSSGDWGIIGMRNVVSFQVPAGQIYRVTTTTTITRWSELR